MQRSLRSLLSVDVAELMSGKVKYYVFRKLGHVPLEEGTTKNALEQYICRFVSQEQPLEILLG